MGFIEWDVQAARITGNWDAVRARVKKADGDLTYTYMNTNGGLMSPDDASKFWKKNILASKFIKLGTSAPMKKNVMNFPTIGISSTRISHPHSPGTALPEAQRASPETTNVQLSAQWFQAEIPITDDIVADNIEGEAFKNNVWSLAREKIVSEIEYYGLISDTASATADLTAFDGLAKSITTNTKDYGGTGLTRANLKAHLALMPIENKGDKNQLKWITSVNAAEHYEDQIAQLNLELAALMYVAGGKDVNAGYNKVGLLPLPVMPENIGTGSNKTYNLLGNPKGVYWGFHKDVYVEFDRDARAGVTTAIFRYRFDCKPADENAWVKGYDVAPSP